MPPTTIKTRFFSKTKKESSGCLLWTGSKRHTYGEFYVNGRKEYAHRAAWFIEHGVWCKTTRHKCDTPLCVNVLHLEDGTQADNVRDMWERGRASSPPIHRGETHPEAKLTEAQVSTIRSEYVPRKVSQRFLARKYGVSQPLIGMIVRGEIWQETEATSPVED